MIRIKFVVLIFISCILIACGKQNDKMDESEKPPALIEKINGSPFNHVILTKETQKRIDLQMVSIQIITNKSNSLPQYAIPYSAIIYGLHGETWVYIAIKPNVFVRMPVTVDHIENNVAILATAPFVTNHIVSVGATELYGSEYLGNIQP